MILIGMTNLKYLGPSWSNQFSSLSCIAHVPQSSHTCAPPASDEVMVQQTSHQTCTSLREHSGRICKSLKTAKAMPVAHTCSTGSLQFESRNKQNIEIHGSTLLSLPSSRALELRSTGRSSLLRKSLASTCVARQSVGVGRIWSRLVLSATPAGNTKRVSKWMKKQAGGSIVSVHAF